MINKKVYRNYEELSKETARFIAQILADKPGSMLCFPAGETSVGTFAELVKLYKSGEADFTKCKIVGLDEWVHLGEMQNENCYNFLKKQLFDAIEVNSANLCFFNGESNNLEYECSKTDDFIKTNGGIDMMLLGVGMNGHIGLNEPGTPFDLYSHVVELDDVTKSVAQKYFTSKTSISKGITLGMKHVMETKTLILQMSGKKKSPVVKQLLETEVTTAFPATKVKQHPNAFLLLDNEANSF